MLAIITITLYTIFIGPRVSGVDLLATAPLGIENEAVESNSIGKDPKADSSPTLPPVAEFLDNSHVEYEQKVCRYLSCIRLQQIP